MYEEFQERVKYSFKNNGLLSIAFTHSSYAHENGGEVIENNERFEFLGDAVLELTISDYLFNSFPELSEGELTKFRAGLVCEPSLAKLSRSISLNENLKLGKGEEATGGRERDSIVADAFEAVIGAVYLDGGMDKARTYIIRLFEQEIKDMRNNFMFNDYKTFLQEALQKDSKEPAVYKITDENGPAHSKTFTANVIHDGQILGKGTGRNKKEAEQNAAYSAIKKMDLN